MVHPPLPQRLLDEEQQRLGEREAVEDVERRVAVGVDDVGQLGAAAAAVALVDEADERERGAGGRGQQLQPVEDAADGPRHGRAARRGPVLPLQLVAAAQDPDALHQQQGGDAPEVGLAQRDGKAGEQHHRGPDEAQRAEPAGRLLEHRELERQHGQPALRRRRVVFVVGDDRADARGRGCHRLLRLEQRRHLVVVGAQHVQAAGGKGHAAIHCRSTALLALDTSTS